MIFRLVSGIIFFLISTADASCQQTGWPYSQNPEMSNQANNYFPHQSIQPYVQHYSSDTSESINGTTPSKGTFRPLAYLSGGVELSPDTHGTALTLAGIEFQKKFSRKWSLLGSYVAGLAVFPNYLKQFSDEQRIFPGLGYIRSKPEEALDFAHNFIGSLTFTPTKHFSFQLGNGKNFWGNGYRSLILSDFASPYPYFKINTRVWKIQYTNLYSRMQNLTETRLIGDARTKYMASHALSLNIGKKLNVTLFESVVWQAEDSLSNRGFEFNYLNPVIFYRPVEYYQGSADNVLLGLGFNWQVISKIDFYGQLMIDEFLLKEVLARDGWWGNKYAAQLGFRVRDLFTRNLNMQSEFNLARPFTYTHGSAVQSYTHLGQSIAHPLGTNFFELVNILSYENWSWKFTEQLNISKYGRDVDNNNFGGDIFRSYANPFQEYDNQIGQGLEVFQYYNRLTIEKQLSQAGDVSAFISHILRFQKYEIQNMTDHFILIGLRANMSRPTIDF